MFPQLGIHGKGPFYCGLTFPARHCLVGDPWKKKKRRDNDSIFFETYLTFPVDLRLRVPANLRSNISSLKSSFTLKKYLI
jgi:hypothetical protein